jgi:hypothetical protein
MSQLHASIASARGWSRFLLDDESIAKPERARAVLRLNERIFRKSVGDLHFRRLFAERGSDPFDAVVVDDERLPDAFRSQRYPEMIERLAERRSAASI